VTSRPTHSGFEPRTRDAERRDFFDLRRKLAKVEEGGGGGGGAGDEVWIGPDDPGLPNFELWYDTDAPGPAGLPVVRRSVLASNTNIISQASTILCSLTIQNYPVGSLIVVTYTLRYAMTTAASFDVHCNASQLGNSIHQVTDATAQVKAFSQTLQYLAPTAGQVFSLGVHAWGGQTVNAIANSNLLVVNYPTVSLA
jgi:hypothetical protein